MGRVKHKSTSLVNKREKENFSWKEKTTRVREREKEICRQRWRHSASESHCLLQISSDRLDFAKQVGRHIGTKSVQTLASQCAECVQCPASVLEKKTNSSRHSLYLASSLPSSSPPCQAHCFLRSFLLSDGSSSSKIHHPSRHHWQTLALAAEEAVKKAVATLLQQPHRFELADLRAHICSHSFRTSLLAAEGWSKSKSKSIRASGFEEREDTV